MRFLYILLLFLFTTSVVFAQENDTKTEQTKKVFPFGVIEEIQSKELSEKRILNIYLPQGYDPDSAATYPTVYVLDGSAHEDFPHIAGLVQFLNMYEIMPKSIVVGIANVDRYRDFTHVTNSKQDLIDLPTGGGSKPFLAFIENELQPFINKHYKTNGHKTIIGQSMGGLLAAEVLLRKPHLFEDYIIVSPSLWWDDQSLVNQADSIFKAHSSIQKKVFLSMGKEHPVMHEVADKLASAIRNSGNEGIRFFYETLLKENHATILHRAVYKGFERLNEKEEAKE